MVGSDAALPLPWLAPALARALAQPGHAVLLHGPQGVGQWELALTLAQAWLCETEASAARRPCGRCAACRLVQARSHPDLLVLLPEALQEPLGWASEGEGGESTGSKTKQPSKEIKVDAVRAAVAFAQTTSSRGRGKALVVHPAERMNAIAANALLKTLEEPPGAARFVLSSAAPQALLPTIRSRCQALPLALPPRDEAAAWLAGQGIARPEVLLAAAGGQPLDALEWHAIGVDAKAWADLPRRVAAGDATAFSGWPLPRVIEALQKLCHDAASVAAGASPRYFEAMPAVPPAMLPALMEWSGALSLAARHAEHPLNAGLAIEAWTVQGRHALAPAGRTASLHSAA